MRQTLRNKEIPVLRAGKLTEIDNEDSIDVFYAIGSESEKEEALKLIKSKFNPHSLFNTYSDFKNNTKISSKKWYCDGDVMIYENKNRTNQDAIVIGVEGSYECVLLVSVKKIVCVPCEVEVEFNEPEEA